MSRWTKAQDCSKWNAASKGTATLLWFPGSRCPASCVDMDDRKSLGETLNDIFSGVFNDRKMGPETSAMMAPEGKFHGLRYSPWAETDSIFGPGVGAFVVLYINISKGSAQSILFVFLYIGIF